MGAKLKIYNAKAYPFRSQACFWLCYLLIGLMACAFFITGFIIFLRDNDDLKGTAADVQLRKAHALHYYDLLHSNITYTPPQTPIDAYEIRRAQIKSSYKAFGYHYWDYLFIWIAQNIAMPILVPLITIMPITKHGDWTIKYSGRHGCMGGLVGIFSAARCFLAMLLPLCYGLDEESKISAGAFSRVWALLLMLFGFIDFTFLFGYLFWRLGLPEGRVGEDDPMKPLKPAFGDIELQPIQAPRAGVVETSPPPAYHRVAEIPAFDPQAYLARIDRLNRQNSRRGGSSDTAVGSEALQLGDFFRAFPKPPTPARAKD